MEYPLRLGALYADLLQPNNSITLFRLINLWLPTIYIVYIASNFCGRWSSMNSSKMALQDPTITHQLFQLIATMSEDEKYTLLKLLKRGALKSKGRRQNLRKRIHTPVHYTYKYGLYVGVTRDISLGGVFILSQKAFSLGQSVSLCFYPDNPEKKFWITGDVIRVTLDGFGVRFRSMNEIQKTAVMSFA